MNIETRFSIGDRVYIPWCDGAKEVRTPCPVCGGKHIIKINGGTFTCNHCYDGYIRSHEYVYYPRLTTVGQVRFTVTSEYHVSDDDMTAIEEYMLVATGVGSGAEWKVDQLYSSKEECEAECVKRNTKTS